LRAGLWQEIRSRFLLPDSWRITFLSLVQLQVLSCKLQGKTSCKCQVVSCIRTAVRLKAMNPLIAGKTFIAVRWKSGPSLPVPDRGPVLHKDLSSQAKIADLWTVDHRRLTFSHSHFLDLIRTNVVSQVVEIHEFLEPWQP